MPIRLGFVGLSTNGWASWMLAPPLFQPPLSSSYTLSAVSTSNPTSAAISAAKYCELAKGAVKGYDGPTTAIAADPDLDMIAVAVKAPLHKEAAIPVIQAGKDLFIEWPAGKTLQETRELAEAAQRKGIRTMVGTQGRQSLVLNKLKETIESGKIGRVLSTTVVARPPRDPFYAWGPYIAQATQYTADAEQGATLLDIIIGHFLDSFTYALGPFTSISTTTANQYPTAELVDASGKPTGTTIAQTGANQIAISGLLSGGAVASLHWRGGMEGKPGRAGTPFLWLIDGEKGTIRVESEEPNGCYIHIVEPRLYLNGQEIKLHPDGMTNLGRAWAEFAKGREGRYATLDDAVRNKVLLDAIVTSAKEGRRIEL